MIVGKEGPPGGNGGNDYFRVGKQSKKLRPPKASLWDIFIPSHSRGYSNYMYFTVHAQKKLVQVHQFAHTTLSSQIIALN